MSVFAASSTDGGGPSSCSVSPTQKEKRKIMMEIDQACLCKQWVNSSKIQITFHTAISVDQFLGHAFLLCLTQYYLLVID